MQTIKTTDQYSLNDYKINSNSVHYIYARFIKEMLIGCKNTDIQSKKCKQYKNSYCRV